MSGFAAHKMAGFIVPKEVLVETDRMVTGDSENEIRRNVDAISLSKLENIIAVVPVIQGNTRIEAGNKLG